TVHNLPACTPAPTTAWLPDYWGGGSSTTHGRRCSRPQCRCPIAYALAARRVLEWLQEQLVAWEVMLVLVR
ncbi:hypothetical protein BDW60DRAFT_201066, partial [Aspergillus nidulans var. acristatus]